MTEEEKKAIESFKEENDNDLSRFDEFNTYSQFTIKRDKILLNLFSKLQKENEKKDKVINYIFEYLTDTEWDNCCFECKQLHSCPQDYDVLLECIKQYFYGKVENHDNSTSNKN